MVGFAAALGITPIVRRVAIRFGLIDNPVGLKIHKRPTPLMGGVGVYLAFVIASVTVLPPSKPVQGVLAGGLAAIIVGVLDEVFSLPPLHHLAGQALAAVIAIVMGIGVVQSLSSPFTALTAPGFKVPALVGLVFTLLWLVGMMNTINFLDGLDGLATGIAALSALLLAIWASEPTRFGVPSTAHHEDLILPLALAGALLGFLPYNWHVARIFLGDSGSMFLGLAIGSLAIVGPTKLGTALLVLLIPMLDVAWAIVRRQLSGRSFLGGDKQHVYHRLLQLGLGHTTTVLVLYVLCFDLAILDLMLVKLAKLIAFVVLTVLVGAAFVLLEIRATRRANLAAAGKALTSTTGTR